MREKKMPLTLQEKLKEAKKKGQLKKLIELITSETGCRQDSIEVSSISYQEVVDHVYDLLVLEKDVFDINPQKECFLKFLNSIPSIEYLITYFITENNVFSLKIKCRIIKDNPDFF